MDTLGFVGVHTAASWSGIAIDAVAALARHKSLNVAQKRRSRRARRSTQARALEEPSASNLSASVTCGVGLFGMLAVFATFKDVRREQQMKGIAPGEAPRLVHGGKARLDRERVKRLAQEGFGPAKIAREQGWRAARYTGSYGRED